MSVGDRLIFFAAKLLTSDGIQVESASLAFQMLLCTRHAVIDHHHLSDKPQD
jgi:hypothetical protein